MPFLQRGYRKFITPKYLLGYGGVGFVLTILTAWLFFWNRDWELFSDKLVLDNELWAHFGDFIGGLSGPFLAFIGVVITCYIFLEQSVQTTQIHNEQKQLQADAQKTAEIQSETQRFNALFFELVNLHYNQLESLKNKPLNDVKSHVDQTKDYFSRFREELYQKKSSNKSYAICSKIANRRYLELYLSNAEILAPYFRTLYRLFELIDSAEIEEDEKMRYAKIARALLTEDELFMLRYNASTIYGNKFAEYINKYRLLKHLPILSLCEFKNINSILDGGDALYQYSLNMFFFKTAKIIYD